MNQSFFETNTFIAVILIFGLLTSANIWIAVLKTKNRQKNYTELQLRTRSWWWMIGLVVGALALGQTATITFFGFLSFLALKEFFSIVPTRIADRRLIFWAYLAIPLQYYWVATTWYGMFLIFIPVYVFLFLPMRAVLVGETKGFIHANAVIHWSMMLCVFSFSHIAYLANLPVKNFSAGFAGPVLFLIFVTQFNDVSQYVWGKTFGRHKIIPKVSPNKTWEGFLGGLFTTILVSAVIAPLLTPLSVWHGVLAGLLIGVTGFIGDVVISSVKRDLHIKDTGTLIPGHGGLLDRIDSLMYTAPLFFHYLYYFYY